MGTRHLTMVHSGGEYPVSQYGQWDGYPSGQGTTILEFLKNSDMAKFKEQVDSLTQLTPEQVESKWVEKGAKPGDSFVSMDIAADFREDYPHLSRDTGSEILQLIYEGTAKEVYLDIDFAADSLFCEWCYVIDLDTRVFEVYKGFNTKKLTKKDRFKFLEDKANGEYHPVKLIATYPLSNLPDSLAELEQEDEEEV